MARNAEELLIDQQHKRIEQLESQLEYERRKDRGDDPMKIMLLMLFLGNIRKQVLCNPQDAVRELDKMIEQLRQQKKLAEVISS